MLVQPEHSLSCVTLRPQVKRRDPRKWCGAQAVSGLRHCRAFHTPLGEEHLLVQTRSSCTCQAQTILKTSPQWASESNFGKLAKRLIGKTAKLIVSWMRYSGLTVTYDP